MFSNEEDLEVVGEAADGLQTVALAAELRPDVVLMDLRMPVLDGVEATRRVLVAERPEVAGDRLLFSVKESLYKAWYPRERAWLAFADALVRVEDGLFTAEITAPGTGGTRRLRGRWALLGGVLATAVVVPAGRWRAAAGCIASAERRLGSRDRG